MPDVLKNKSYKDYSYVSRYISIPYYYNTEDDKYIYGTAQQLNDSTAYALHEVKRGDTLDSLALKYYNNPTLFWIIADFNKIQDPFATLTVGEKLKIPSISSISFVNDGV